MEIDAGILTALPPALAIFAEWRNPVSDEAIARQARETIETLGLVARADPNDPAAVTREGQARANLQTAITGVAHGATSVASLIPTGIAVVISAIAVVNEFAARFWLVDIIFIVTILGTIYILQILGASSYFDIATDRVAGTNVTRAEWFSRGIYAVNLALIVLIGVTVYYTGGLEHPAHAQVGAPHAATEPRDGESTGPAGVATQ